MIRSGEGVVAGPTTASSIWVVAGAGLYVLAPVAALVVILILRLPRKISGE